MRPVDSTARRRRRRVLSRRASFATGPTTACRLHRGEDVIQVLPADARIRRGRDFSSVFKRGHRAARGGVVVHWMSPNDPRAGEAAPAAGEAPASPKATPSDADVHHAARAGFVVSKSVGNAVVRNRVKRRLRHAAAELMADWPDGTDVVVRATPKAAERDFSELRRDLADAVALARSGKGKRGRRPRSAFKDSSPNRDTS